MDVLAALGNATTAVIAVVAIVLGMVLVARGQRGERAAGVARASEAGPSPSTAPIAAAEPASDTGGLQKMAVGEVGHGAIRLGSAVRRREPDAAPQTQTQALTPDPPTASGAVPFRQGTIKLRKPPGD
jgi:hypothetical protein